MKPFTYLSYDVFFGLVEDMECSESRALVYKMADAVINLREYAKKDRARYDDTTDFADACDMAADEISSRLEDFVTLKAKERTLCEASEANPHLS